MRKCYTMSTRALERELEQGKLVLDEKGRLMPPYGNSWFDSEGEFTDDGEWDTFKCIGKTEVAIPGKSDVLNFCKRELRVSYCHREESLWVGEVSIHASADGVGVPKVLQLTAIEPEWLRCQSLGFKLIEHEEVCYDFGDNPQSVTLQVYRAPLYFKVPRTWRTPVGKEFWDRKLNPCHSLCPEWIEEMMVAFRKVCNRDCYSAFTSYFGAFYPEEDQNFDMLATDLHAFADLDDELAAVFIQFLWEVREALVEVGRKDLAMAALSILLPRGEEVEEYERRSLEYELRELWRTTTAGHPNVDRTDRILSFLIHLAHVNDSLGEFIERIRDHRLTATALWL